VHIGHTAIGLHSTNALPSAPPAATADAAAATTTTTHLARSTQLPAEPHRGPWLLVATLAASSSRVPKSSGAAEQQQ
jgi:hypothetical protein